MCLNKLHCNKSCFSLSCWQESLLASNVSPKIAETWTHLTSFTFCGHARFCTSGYANLGNRYMYDACERTRHQHVWVDVIFTAPTRPLVQAAGETRLAGLISAAAFTICSQWLLSPLPYVDCNTQIQKKSTGWFVTCVAMAIWAVSIIFAH